MKKTVFIFFLFFAGCTGNDTLKDVQGIVKSAFPKTLTIPAQPPPVITIMGRNADDFDVEYVQNTLNTAVANFVIHGVPQKQPVIFELKSGSFDPIVTFPFDLKVTPLVTLPALPTGFTAALVTQIQTLSGSTVTQTTGIVLGQLASEGSAGGGCAPLNSVIIKNKETNITITALGPYYFDTLGNLVNTHKFSDTQCNYVIANILPGVYLLNFLDASLAKQAEQEVVVLKGTVSFGMDIP